MLLEVLPTYPVSFIQSDFDTHKSTLQKYKFVPYMLWVFEMVFLPNTTGNFFMYNTSIKI